MSWVLFAITFSEPIHILQIEHVANCSQKWFEGEQKWKNINLFPIYKTINVNVLRFPVDLMGLRMFSSTAAQWPYKPLITGQPTTSGIVQRAPGRVASW